jgi:tetratricopeptide (TPR) repeat protein
MTVLLAVSSGAGVILPALAQDQAQAQSQWKDRAEYDMFNSIIQATDPRQKVELADKYLAAYPETKFAEGANELKLQGYQALNDTPNMEATANKLLEINPNNLRALLLVSYLFPRTINQSDPAMEQKLDKAAELAQRGLSAVDAMTTPPQGVAPDAFQKQKDQTASVFHQTLGFAALQKKDYAGAVQSLSKSTQMNPTDALGFYWLGLSYLSPKPPDYEQGIWAMAHALSISGPAALPEANKATVKDYLTKVYEARHGSTDGLDELLAQAASAPAPPAGFHIMTAEEMAPPEPEPEPVPPPRELTVKAEELTDFGKIQEYLQAGGLKEEDTWTIMKGQNLPLPGKVVSATPAARPTKVLLAVNPALAQEPGKHDVELTLAEPHAKALQAGQDVNFEGTWDAYTSDPFVIKIIDGKITP